MIYSRRPLPIPGLGDRADVRKLDDDLFRYLNETDEGLDSVLNYGLTFEDNFDGVFVTFTSSATPDAENTVPHSLGKIPTGYIVTSLDKGAVVYSGTTAFTDTSIYLKVNVATVVVTIFVF